MVRCPDCDGWVNETAVECPRCGRARSDEELEESAKISRQNDPSLGATEDPDDGAEGRQAIARFRNAAEAGFFLDELTRRLDITAEVAPAERFDALHASWSTDFVLLVPRESAELAARCLQELVDQTTESDDDEEVEGASRANPVFSSRVLFPLAITLAAGALSYWAFDRLDRPQGAHAAGR